MKDNFLNEMGYHWVMKGVILTNGYGTKLRPFTYVVNKSVLPVYDKPVIYFPVTTLINAGIEDILITARNPKDFERVLRDEKFSADISFMREDEPIGTKRSLYNMKEFIKGVPTLVILGDIYLTFGIKTPETLDGCVVSVSSFFDSKRISEYGVVQLDGDKVLSFEEKPNEPKGRFVNMSATFFPADLINVIEKSPVRDGENLTDLANQFLKMNRLSAEVYAQPWFNVGTPEDAFLAAQFRREHRQH